MFVPGEKINAVDPEVEAQDRLMVDDNESGAKDGSSSDSEEVGVSQDAEAGRRLTAIHSGAATGNEKREEEEKVTQTPHHSFGDPVRPVYLPEDTFSIMAISWPWSAKGEEAFSAACSAFALSISIFGIQACILVLLFLDIFSHEEFWQNLASPVVRWAQLITIIIAVMSQQDTLWSINIWINRFPGIRPWAKSGRHIVKRSTELNALITKPENDYPENDGIDDMPLYDFTPHFWVWHLANILRFIEGFACLTVTLLLIMESNSVRDVLLNFAAAEFVSGLDNMTFGLAKWRYFGQPIHRVAMHPIISEDEFRPYPTMVCYSRNWTRLICLSLLAVTGIISWIALCHIQFDNLPKSIIVQFGDDENFTVGFASGNYSRAVRKGAVMMHQNDLVYKLNDLPEDDNPFALKFCFGDSRWRLLKSEDDNCSTDSWFVETSSMARGTFSLPSSEDHRWYTRSSDGRKMTMEYIRILHGEDSIEKPDDFYSECPVYRANDSNNIVDYLFRRLDGVKSNGRPVFAIEFDYTVGVYMSVGRRWAYVQGGPQFIPDRLCTISGKKLVNLEGCCSTRLTYPPFTQHETSTIKGMIETLIWQLRNEVENATVFPKWHVHELPHEHQFNCSARDVYSLKDAGAIPSMFSSTYDVQSSSDSGSPRLLMFHKTKSYGSREEGKPMNTELGPYQSMPLNTKHLEEELKFQNFDSCEE